MSLAIPSTHRRATVRSFWLVISSFVGFTLMILATVCGWSSPIAIGLLSATVLGLLVFMQERLIRCIYEAWNPRLVYPYADIAQRILSRICYFVVFATVGRGGSKLVLTACPHLSSLWTNSSSQAWADPTGDRSKSGRSGRTRLEWVRGYISWSIHSGNAWALSLLPFLAILRFCSVPQQRAVQSNIYTLF